MYIDLDSFACFSSTGIKNSARKAAEIPKYPILRTKMFP